jgi:hypothetical protein
VTLRHSQELGLPRSGTRARPAIATWWMHALTERGGMLLDVLRGGMLLDVLRSGMLLDVLLASESVA